MVKYIYVMVNLKVSMAITMMMKVILKKLMKKETLRMMITMKGKWKLLFI